jgi:DsbC/DsbD-like thiol-disulfide interchange protein
LFGISGPAAEPPSDARLIADSARIQAGRPFSLGILITLDPGWHTYWKNPGTSGMPPDMTWQLPPGFEGGPVQWPAPSVVGPADMPDYGYEKKVLLMRTVTPSSWLQDRDYRFTVKLAWMICKDVCVQRKADLVITLPAGNASKDSPWKRDFDDARSALPVLDPAWSFKAGVHGKNLDLTIIPPPGQSREAIARGTFIPLENGLLEAGHPPAWQAPTNTPVLSLRLLSPTAPRPERLAGLFLLPGEPGAGARRALQIDIPFEKETKAKQGD